MRSVNYYTAVMLSYKLRQSIRCCNSLFHSSFFVVKKMLLNPLDVKEATPSLKEICRCYALSVCFVLLTSERKEERN